ncbi:hypothetical protein E2C01_006804 [Portunus trituberculatus]|uniref:Uncharacterized protein n=1 Tax=Portunus trituberculatus TaxID=210409 RepID=A0A5B7CWC1_PORTR|nr:hypothetical protein [Portunus trituberculatus]
MHTDPQPHSPAVAPHDLQNEAALVGVGGGGNGIHSLDDAVQCRVSADGHVGATEVVVNGADHAHNIERNLPFLRRSCRRETQSCRKRLAPVSEPSPPITTRLVMPRLIRFLAALIRPSRSRKSMQRAEPITVPPCTLPYLMDDARHRRPVGFHDVVPAIHHALVALLDEVHPGAHIQTHANHRPHCRVHAL